MFYISDGYNCSKHIELCLASLKLANLF